MTKMKQYPIGITFVKDNEIENYTAELTVNPISKTKKYNKTFELKEKCIRKITKKLKELKYYIKEENIQSVAIEEPNLKDHPQLWEMEKTEIIRELNELDIPIIVYGKGENIKKPKINLTSKELKAYKNYLENYFETQKFDEMTDEELEKLEDKRGWTNDIMLNALRQNKKDLGRVIQQSFLYQYAFKVGYKPNGKSIPYPQSKKCFIKDIKYALAQCNIRIK